MAIERDLFGFHQKVTGGSHDLRLVGVETIASEIVKLVNLGKSFLKLAA